MLFVLWIFNRGLTKSLFNSGNKDSGSEEYDLFGVPRCICFFSANTMTGKSACSHPAQPAWVGTLELQEVKKSGIEISTPLFHFVFGI